MIGASVAALYLAPLRSRRLGPLATSLTCGIALLALVQPLALSHITFSADRLECLVGPAPLRQAGFTRLGSPRLLSRHFSCRPVALALTGLTSFRVPGVASG